MPVAGTMLKSWSRSRILVSTSMTLQGSSAHDVRKRFATARNCTASIDGNVWHSCISLPTKLRLYRVFVLPVILYGAWFPTPWLARNLDAFDQWCLWHILGISWTACITNEEVRRRTDHPPLSHTSSVPPALHSSFTLHVPVHLWTTVRAFVSSLCWGTGTANQADRVTPGCGPLNPI